MGEALEGLCQKFRWLETLVYKYKQCGIVPYYKRPWQSNLGDVFASLPPTQLIKRHRETSDSEQLEETADLKNLWQIKFSLFPL